MLCTLSYKLRGDMMSKREILLLGDENLYKVSEPIQKRKFEHC